MNIRVATSIDVNIIVEFQKAMAWETEKIQLDHETVMRGVTNVLADEGKGRYYLAEENKKVVGCLMTTFEWSDWRNGTVLWIQSVYIDAAWRGKGVYRKLYHHIQELVSNNSSLRGIRLYVDKTNTTAQKVYKQLGMNGEHYQVYEWMKS